MSLNLYDDFGENREAMCSLESASLAADRACFLYESFCEMEEFNVREAEIKCIEESGDALDLMDYYEEAKEQTEEKKKGIFVRAWEAILRAIKKLKATLFGGEVDDSNEKTSIDKGALTFVDRLCGFWDKIKSFIKHPIKNIAELLKSKDTLKTLGTIAITSGVTVVITKAALAAKDRKLQEATDEIERVTGDIIDAAGNIISSNEDTKGLTTFFNDLRSKIETGANITRRILDKSLNAVKGAASTVKDKVPQIEQKDEPLGLPYKGGQPRDENGMTKKQKRNKKRRDQKNAHKRKKKAADARELEVVSSAHKGEGPYFYNDADGTMDDLYDDFDLFDEDADLFDDDFLDDDLYEESAYDAYSEEEDDDDLFEEDASSYEEVEDLLEGLI